MTTCQQRSYAKAVRQFGAVAVWVTLSAAAAEPSDANPNIYAASMSESLAAGTYTIEAVAAAIETSGDFSLGIAYTADAECTAIPVTATQGWGTQDRNNL